MGTYTPENTVHVLVIDLDNVNLPALVRILSQEGHQEVGRYSYTANSTLNIINYAADLHFLDSLHLQVD